MSINSGWTPLYVASAKDIEIEKYSGEDNSYIIKISYGRDKKYEFNNNYYRGDNIYYRKVKLIQNYFSQDISLTQAINNYLPIDQHDINKDTLIKLYKVAKAKENKELGIMKVNIRKSVLTPGFYEATFVKAK